MICNNSYDDNGDCFCPIFLEPYVIGDDFMWNWYDTTTNESLLLLVFATSWECLHLSLKTIKIKKLNKYKYSIYKNQFFLDSYLNVRKLKI